jgi:hypothetical protein
MPSSQIEGVAMKKIPKTQEQGPMTFANIPDTYKTKEAKRRRGSDPTYLVMSVMVGIGMGLLGLMFTGQL